MNKQIFCFVCALLCALIWGANLAADLLFGQTGALLTCLHTVCMAVWCVVAVAWWLRAHR